MGARAALQHFDALDQSLCCALPSSCLQAFQSGIEAALQQRPGADALVLGAGGGLLALLAARAGAGCVTAVERSRMLYRMARQVLEANAEGQHREAVARVHLLDRRLQSVGVQGEAPPPDALLAAEHQRQQQQGGKGQRPGSPDSVAVAAGDESSSSQESGGGAAAEAGALLARRAGLLVTDLLDHAALGLGLLPALDYAAERLLAPGALVVPQRVQVGHGAGSWEMGGQAVGGWRAEPTKPGASCSSTSPACWLSISPTRPPTCQPTHTGLRLPAGAACGRGGGL